jgi:glycosyltransferase involved in cell wall biosynthesis
MIFVQMNKLIYYVDGRMPSLKANGYQSVQMCEAFINNGINVLLLFQNRKIFNIDCKSVNLNKFYDTKTEILSKKIFCIDLIYYLEKLPFYIFNHFFSSFAAILTSFTSIYPLYRELQKNTYNFLYIRSNLFLIGIYFFFPKHILSKVVFEVHDINQSFLGRFFFLQSLRKIHSIVVITENLKLRLIKNKIPSYKILVSPDAVNLNRFQKNLSVTVARNNLGIFENNPIIGFIGRFLTNGNEKGIPEIIKASKFVLNKFPDVKFYFVGGPLERIHLYESLINKYGLPRHSFIFLGNQHVSQVPTFMWACDLLLMPHPWSDFFAYNVSPLKMFEYMASRRPIIASNLPSIREILIHNKNALLIQPGDYHELSESIILLLENRKFANYIIDNSFNDVQNYTWDKRAYLILKFLNKE